MDSKTSDNAWFAELKPSILAADPMLVAGVLSAEEARFVRVAAGADSLHAFLRKTRTGADHARETLIRAVAKIQAASMMTTTTASTPANEDGDDDGGLAAVESGFREVVRQVLDQLKAMRGISVLFQAARTLAECQKGLLLASGKATERIELAAGVPSLKEIIEARKAEFSRADIALVKESIRKELTASSSS